jgi:hypothetical protein
MIEAERNRQRITYTATHDDLHVSAQLARAGISYGITAIWQMFGIEGSDIIAPGNPDSDLEWPWPKPEYHPDELPIKNLVKAAALIAAEIDRMLRTGATT